MSLGLQKGDRVAIYMPMIVEIVVAMLACARIGVIHSIVVSDSCDMIQCTMFIQINTSIQLQFTSPKMTFLRQNLG